MSLPPPSPRGSYSVVNITAGNVDITNFIVNISPATDCGTGEIPMLVAVIDAKNGQFITQGNSNVTPIIDRWTLLQVNFVDPNNHGFSKIYVVDTYKPLNNLQVGDRLEVHAFGQEYWLQRLDFTQQFYFADAYSVFVNLCNKYNANKGANQPILVNLTTTNIQLPQWTANNYLFNVSETAVYTGQMYIIDKLGSSVQNGGAADFFEFRCTDLANGTQLQPEVISSGSTGSNITLTSSTSNIAEVAGDVEAPTGTIIKAWGDDQSGSLPTSFAQFRGIDEAFFLFPAWINGVHYPFNAIVSYDPGTGSNVYQCTNVNGSNNAPNTADWAQIFEYTLLQNNNITAYSLWTNASAGLNAWKCSAANPDSSGSAPFNLPMCWDSNLVVQDGTFYRDFADIREVSDALIPSNIKLLDNNNVPQPYRGMRLLLDRTLGTLGGIFAQNGGKDRFGNAYSNAVVMNNGGSTRTYLDWDCVMTTTNPAKGKAIPLLNNYQCGIIREGRVYGWNGASWADKSGVSKSNDCFHPYTSMVSATGTSSTPLSGGGTYGDVSAIQVTYTWSPLSTTAGFLFTTPNYYSAGCWLNLRFPFPSTKIVGSTDVGSFYGGYHKAYPAEPATLDSLNMNLTHSGNSGFNQVDCEDYGSIYGIGFQMKIRFQDNTGALVTLPSGTFANFKMRCTIYDTQDNVVHQDFTIAFNDVWQDVILPLQQFQIYRARIPLQWGDINALTPLPQLNILNIFEWRNIKQVVLQCQNVYDDQGRYKPEFSDLNNFALVAISVFNQAQLVMTMDSFRFVKPLLAVSGTVNSWAVEPETLQRKQITNYFQLKQDVQSMLQIYLFRHKEYLITTNLRCDIRFGDSFFYVNQNLVSDSDSGISNNIKLVAKRVSYYLNKTDGGPGGLITEITGVKRYPPGGGP